MRKSFDEIAKAVVLNMMSTLFTALPGRLLSDPFLLDNQPVANIQPLINFEDEDGSAQETSSIDEVPIVYPAGGDAILTLPIKAGDTVLLIFSCRSLEEFLASDGSQPLTPFSKRKHALADAIAIPGLFTNQNHLGFNFTDIILKNNTESGVENRLELKESGDIVIQSATKIEIGEGATEALVLGNAFLSLFNSHQHIAGTGPTSTPVQTMTEPQHLSNLSFTRRV